MSGSCAVRGRRFAQPCRKNWPISPGPSCSWGRLSSLPGPAGLEPSVYDRRAAAMSDCGPTERPLTRGPTRTRGFGGRVDSARLGGVQKARSLIHGLRGRLSREHGRLSPLPLRLGNVQREPALELGPPARVTPATSMLRSIGPMASRPTSALVASVFWPALTGSPACVRDGGWRRLR
jgi:hypothetical protein